MQTKGRKGTLGVSELLAVAVGSVLVALAKGDVRTRLIRLYKSLGGGWEALET